MLDKIHSKMRLVRADRHRSYEVFLTDGPVESCFILLDQIIDDRQVLVVTTPTVAALYGDTIRQNLIDQRSRSSLVILDCDEKTKTITKMLEICDQAQISDLDRGSLLIGIGGGVCTDLVSFAASTIRRGLGYIRIPTTLIGQVDAGIGVKSAVNFGARKSYLGSYHAPLATIITPSFLKSLPPRYIRTGFAEILKMAILDSEEFFELVEQNHQTMLETGCASPSLAVTDMIWHSVESMLRHLEPNLYEDQTFKRHVDFGHTFSPALESASGYTIAHGEAVAIDMALSTKLSCHMGLISPLEETRIIKLLYQVGLPVYADLLDRDFCLQALQDATRYRGGNLNLVIPTRIGKTVFVNRISDIPAALLSDAISSLHQTDQELASRMQMTPS